MDKRKRIYISGGTEESHRWTLSIAISAKEYICEPYFALEPEIRKRKRRTIHLASGREDRCGWILILDVSSNQRIWKGSFSVEDEVQKYRHERRKSDYNWANRTFHRQWRQQFEIHHDWLGGEVCYFLTPEQHHALHRELSAEPSYDVSAPSGAQIEFGGVSAL